MTDTTAPFYNNPVSGGRSFGLGACLRGVRVLVDGAAFGVLAVAAVGALAATVTISAAWILNNTLATRPHLIATMPVSPDRLALADHYPAITQTADGSDSTRAADVTGSIRPADPVDRTTFDLKWAYATAPTEGAGPAPRRADAPARQLTASPSNPTPLPPSRPKVQVASASASIQIAELTPMAMPEAARPPSVLHVPEPATAPAARAPPPPAKPEKNIAPQLAHNKQMPLVDPKSRTAIYDISARTVYLPNGEKLEAHSGLGDKRDNPRYVRVKNRGPTPPNVYDLTLRESLFHGVQAIRLNPVDEGKMFGRDGMLAHTYMLGPNGQSNGCVSFKDYRKFLNAVVSGKVDRLVVVPSLGDKPVLADRSRRGPTRRYADNNI